MVLRPEGWVPRIARHPFWAASRGSAVCQSTTSASIESDRPVPICSDATRADTRFAIQASKFPADSKLKPFDVVTKEAIWIVIFGI